MNFKTLIIKLSVLFLVFSSDAFAGEFPAQGRLFLGSTDVNLSQVNANLKADGMATFSTAGQYGLEITYPWKSLNLGMRYHRTDQVAYENPETSATNYQAELIQDEILLLARVPLYKEGILMADFFAGVGGTNTTYKLSTSTQSGQLTKTAPSDWVASPVGAAGISVGIGYNNIYGFIEAGYEYNKVSNFQRTGTINSSVQELDLTGHYILLGIMFDGIKATSK
ncbi:MAG: hypothetical protein ACXVAX_03165 [Pseudobdellovibrio sp.]